MFEVFWDWDKHIITNPCHPLTSQIPDGTSAWNFRTCPKVPLSLEISKPRKTMAPYSFRSSQAPLSRSWLISMDPIGSPKHPISSLFSWDYLTVPSVSINFHPFPSISIYVHPFSRFWRLSLLHWLHPFSQHLPSFSGPSRIKPAENLVDVRQPRREELTLALEGDILADRYRW